MFAAVKDEYQDSQRELIDKGGLGVSAAPAHCTDRAISTASINFSCLGPLSSPALLPLTKAQAHEEYTHCYCAHCTYKIGPIAVRIPPTSQAETTPCAQQQ